MDHPNPAALEPTYSILKRLLAHPEVMMVLLRNPELDRQMAEALRIAEAK